ncbi:MAG: DUF2130 domain-containing protein [Candidatus Woesebacteria bacterium]|nr:MAG: DUF2130 domain-containing protein [Candidatus Woesebacteria bacterium]
MANTIKCPHCGKIVEITEALRHEIKVEVDAEFEKQIREKVKEETSLEIENLEKSLKEKERKEDERRAIELKLREENRKLMEKDKDREIELQRKIDEERQKIEEEALKRASEEHRLKDLDKEKKISDMEKLIEELKRKAQQGSQQTQGEVLELDLEENLRSNYPQDDIEPVGKGVKGADIRQIVKSPKGNICGVILWESKRTKNWIDEWATKLKTDLRSEKADIPVIVTTSVPKSISNGLGFYEGVWVVKFELALVLAQLLRKNILDVARQKAVNAQKSDKASLLYDYVMGHEFRQQVEAVVEIFKEEQELIQKERTVFEKIWKAREARNKRLITSTASIYGGIQGLVGTSMPLVKGLEIEELESGE